jgi:hypothetical protein
MLVYGDLIRTEETAAKAERIRAGLAVLEEMPAGIGRHAEIAAWLVEMGELEQGLLDDQLQFLGRERPTPVAQAAAAVTRGIAEALLWSFRFAGQLPAWEGARRASAPPLVGVMAAMRALRRLASMRLTAEIPVVVPEGYASYGLYPETYLRAAERLREDWQGVLRVIGIRSIGTSLAAMVAAAGKGETSASVRPGGHPFARTLSIGERMTGRLLAASDASGPRRPLYAIADEGPGLSGSSFGSVADWLEEHGVAPESIVFFPSHGGPLGPQASEAHRERWDRARKYVVEFEDLFLVPSSAWPLERWVEDLTGPAEGPLEDLGAGRWRDRFFSGDRPPAHLQQERRKYLLTSRGKTWLLKFAGLGHYGRERLELAQELEKGGFTPPVAGLRHGFLVSPWLDRARPLPLVPDLDREALLDRVARYISFRARRLPAAGRPGASPAKLLEMATFNAGEALGSQASEALGVWKERLPELASLARPVLTDNRMHAWEWLVTPEGKILKADALDHHAGNDLIGAQDPAWDLAGAIVELDLSEEERGRLVEMVERSRRVKTPPDQLRFYTHAYLAFELGWHTLAAQALEGIDPAEAGAMRKRAERYGERLRREL